MGGEGRDRGEPISFMEGGEAAVRGRMYWGGGTLDTLQGTAPPTGHVVGIFSTPPPSPPPPIARRRSWCRRRSGQHCAAQRAQTPPLPPLSPANLSCTDACTKTRLVQMQVWPALRSAESTDPRAASSRSASANTMKGALPPSSRLTRCVCGWGRCEEVWGGSGSP